MNTHYQLSKPQIILYRTISQRLKNCVNVRTTIIKSKIHDTVWYSSPYQAIEFLGKIFYSGIFNSSFKSGDSWLLTNLINIEITQHELRGSTR